MRVDLAVLGVDLVDDEHHRHVAALQHLRDARVFFGDAGGHVDDEQHEVGGAHCRLGLRGHLGGERGRLGREPGFAGTQPAAGVDEHERAAVPFGRELAAVARHARTLFDDGGARADDPVHERRLADVRTTDHRDARQLTGAHHDTLVVGRRRARARRRRSR